MGECDQHAPIAAPVIENAQRAEAEEEDGEGEQSLRYQLGIFGVNQNRRPLECTLFGTSWLAFVRRKQLKTGNRGSSKEDAACRLLYERTESHQEKAKREAAGTEISNMRVWPGWVKNSRICAGILQQLEREGKGPSATIKLEFPSAGVADLPAISLRLLDLASRNGLGKETITNFKRWLSKLLKVYALFIPLPV
jgi:hypothetical protein